MDRLERKKKLEKLIELRKVKELEDIYKSVALEYKECLFDKKNIQILSEENSEIMYKKLEEEYPLSNLGIGGIDWGLMKNNMRVNCVEQLVQFVEKNNIKDFKVFILRKVSTYPGTPPVLCTTFSNIIKSFESIIAEEQIIYGVEEKLVIEIKISGEVMIGWK